MLKEARAEIEELHVRLTGEEIRDSVAAPLHRGDNSPEILAKLVCVKLVVYTSLSFVECDSGAAKPSSV